MIVGTTFVVIGLFECFRMLYFFMNYTKNNVIVVVVKDCQIFGNLTGVSKKKLCTLGCRVILLMEFSKSAQFFFETPVTYIYNIYTGRLKKN